MHHLLACRFRLVSSTGCVFLPFHLSVLHYIPVFAFVILVPLLAFYLVSDYFRAKCIISLFLKYICAFIIVAWVCSLKNIWESGLLGLGVTIRVRGFPVQTPLGNRLGLGTQPCYEAPADFRVKILETQ